MQLVGIALVFLFLLTSCEKECVRWWPTQKPPKQIVRTIWHEEFEATAGPNDIIQGGHLSPTHLMVESVAGLAAAAVNDGKCDEMVWISVGTSRTPNADYKIWYDRAVEQLKFKDNGVLGSWDIVKRFYDKGVIKGYILYSYDTSKGHAFEKRENMDVSANIATALAAVHQGIIIDWRQESKAKELGLKMLADARGKTTKWCFDTYKDKLNRDMVLVTDPKAGHCRDYAIANRCMVVYGDDATVHEVMRWLNPLSTVLGWSYLPEDESTILTSRYGHLQTATNWSLNLSFISALPETSKAKPAYRFDPASIVYNDTQSAMAFVMSDGDNMCWLMGNFVSNPAYWASPTQGQFPMGWTLCPSSLAQASPPTLESLFATCPKDTTFIEYGNGYHYPDYLGKDRDTEAVLAAHARRSWEYMSRMGITVFGFICMDLESEAAQRAYRIYAREMPGLTGMIGVQYYPYEGGNGKVYWVKNADGIEIPVVTCKYALWSNYSAPGGGTPAKVARLINEDCAAAREKNQKSLNWTIVHAWSSFNKIADNNEVAENAAYVKPGTETGMVPVQWCIDRLDKQIKIVSPEELLWCIRMEHNSEQTKTAIRNLGKVQK